VNPTLKLLYLDYQSSKNLVQALSTYAHYSQCAGLIYSCTVPTCCLHLSLSNIARYDTIRYIYVHSKAEEMASLV